MARCTESAEKTCGCHAIEHDTFLLCCSMALLVFCGKFATILIKIEILLYISVQV
jgi:hypothetical protein